MSAAVLYMPFNQQVEARVIERKSASVEQIVPKYVNIEDLGKIEGDLKLNLSVVFERVAARYNAHLDEEARLDVIPLRSAKPFGAVTSMDDFKRAKEIDKENAKIMSGFNALRELKKINNDQGLVKFMQNGRSYGGVNGVDYDLAQEYKMMQGLFAEELENIGIRGIRLL